MCIYIYTYIYEVPLKTVVYYLCKDSSLVSGKCTKYCVAIGPPKAIPIIVHA